MNDEELRPRTLYISRVAYVPAERAAALLGPAIRDLGRSTPRGIEIPLGRWSLELAGADEPPPVGRSAATPVWTRPGRLRARGIWFPVELEVVRWSARASEIALRPAWRRCHPAGPGFRGYLAHGARALDALRFEIELRDLMGRPEVAA